jgi:hypothetical protein
MDNNNNQEIVLVMRTEADAEVTRAVKEEEK